MLKSECTNFCCLFGGNSLPGALFRHDEPPRFYQRLNFLKFRNSVSQNIAARSDRRKHCHLSFGWLVNNVKMTESLEPSLARAPSFSQAQHFIPFFINKSEYNRNFKLPETQRRTETAHHAAPPHYTRIRYSVLFLLLGFIYLGKRH